jgi:hypothetical protein
VTFGPADAGDAQQVIDIARSTDNVVDARVVTSPASPGQRLLTSRTTMHLFALAPDAIGQHLLQDRLGRIRTDHIG